ncbi:PucR family transcriptional regulator [Blastococcus sp. SYSU D00695]
MAGRDTLADVDDPAAVTGPSPGTLRRLERASGAIATQAVARMDDQLPWFRTMPADQRSWVMLVAQAGIASLVEWCRNPARPPRLTGEVFGAAPRELVRAVPLKQTVDLVKVVVEVIDDHVREVAEPGDADALRMAVLVFSREVAFATAHVYATFAEDRGAWDARLEALVVDALVRGERSEELPGRAAALGWSATTPVTVLVGAAPSDRDAHAAARRAARSMRSEVLVGVHAEQLVVVLGGAEDLPGVADRVAEEFGPGPVVVGPVVEGLARAPESAAAALAGLRAAPAWPGAPRPVDADALLPERALDGDPLARATLEERIALPLQAAGGEVLETVGAVLASGGNLEASARALFVHPNTVRYRLKRAAELTGSWATDPRGGWTLQVALALSRLGGERSLWH